MEAWVDEKDKNDSANIINFCIIAICGLNAFHVKKV